jgi:hypothetical protein
MVEPGPQLLAAVRISNKATDVTLSCVIAAGCLFILLCCCLGEFISTVFDDNTSPCVKAGLVASLPLVRPFDPLFSVGTRFFEDEYKSSKALTETYFCIV